MIYKDGICDITTEEGQSYEASKCLYTTETKLALIKLNCYTINILIVFSRVTNKDKN